MAVDPTLILDPVDWNHAAGRGLGTTPIRLFIIEGVVGV